MKKITLLFVLLAITFGFAQQTTYNITFEPGTDGSDPNEWSTFENADGDNADAIVANPNTSGINTSATVLQMDTNVHVSNGGASQIYAGLQSQQPGVFGTWELDASTTTLTIMVYKSEISETRVQFVNATNGTLFQLAQSNTAVNTWEMLIYDLTPFITNPENVNVNRIVIFPDWQERSQVNTNYIDNITFTANAIAAATEPTDAPEAPTALAADVISIYSNAYTDVTVNGFNQFGGSTLTDEVIAGNDVKKYVNLDFTGIEFTGANLIDATAMTTLHIDVWSPDTNDFKVKLVDFGADEAFQGGDDTEFELTFTAPTAGQWNAYDIPLTNFTGINTDNLAQLILVKGGGTAFVDNIYFYAAPPTAPTVAAPTPPARNASDVVSIFSGAYTNVALSELPTTWSQLGQFAVVPIAGDDTWELTGCEFLGMVTNYANGVDLSQMETMHIDYWTPDTNEISIKLVNTTLNPVEEDIESLGATVTGSWQSVEIDMSGFASRSSQAVTLDKITQILIDPSAPSLVYIDNFYFYKGNALSTDEFSQNEFVAYPNPTNNNWTIKGNNTIKTVQVYDVLGKQVITLSPNTDNVSIDATSLNSGLYFAKVNSANGSKSIKLIKN
ncbi:T9SS type A sorting domain-containing protein [Lacinutrix salivirga]